MAAPQEKPKGAEGISISISPDALMHILSSFHGGKSGPGGSGGTDEIGQGSSGQGIGSQLGERPGQMWGARPVSEGASGTGTGGFNPTASLPAMEAQSSGTTGPGPQATFLGRSTGIKSSTPTKTPSFMGSR